MKSRERSYNGLNGIGRGHNKPVIRLVSYLVNWHSAQLATNFATSALRPGHVKFSDNLAIVFVTPVCPPMGVEWY